MIAATDQLPLAVLKDDFPTKALHDLCFHNGVEIANKIMRRERKKLLTLMKILATMWKIYQNKQAFPQGITSKVTKKDLKTRF